MLLLLLYYWFARPSFILRSLLLISLLIDLLVHKVKWRSDSAVDSADSAVDFADSADFAAAVADLAQLGSASASEQLQLLPILHATPVTHA